MFPCAKTCASTSSKDECFDEPTTKPPKPIRYSSLSNLHISPFQRSLLQSSWSHMGKFGPSGFGSLILKRVLQLCPETKRVFNLGSVDPSTLEFDRKFLHHSNAIQDVLGKAVANLDRWEKYVIELRQFGANHARLTENGFHKQFWDDFAEALTVTTIDWLKTVRFHKETVRAWTLLVALIVAEMRVGYEMAQKRSPDGNRPFRKRSGTF